MSAAPHDRSRPAQAAPEVTTTSASVEREALRRFADAYAVLVVGKATRRHVFFNLPAAERAVDRAHSRGDDAVLVLVRLVPVAGTVPELRTMGGTS